MPVQESTATTLVATPMANFLQNLFQRHAGDSVNPASHDRDFVAVMADYLADTSAVIVEDSVTSTADGAASGIDVLLPFVPKIVIVINQTDALAYIKMASMAGEFSLKFTGVPAMTFANTTVKMGNTADDNTSAFAINAAEIAAASKVISYIAIG